MLFCMMSMIAMYSPASRAASIIPFAATIGFDERIGPGTSACFLTGAIAGTGTATKLGAVSLGSEDCINPISATTFLFVSDKVVLSANGGQIWAAWRVSAAGRRATSTSACSWSSYAS